MKYASVEELLFALVAIDSPSGYEREVAEFVAEFLKGLGLSPSIDDTHNVYCRIGEGNDPLLFCNHLDTVEPGRGIEPYIDDDGVIRSRGETILGGDNKVAVAALLFALQERGVEGLNLELLLTSREETTSGIKDFDMSRVSATRAIVVDGGGGELSWLAAQAPTIIDFEITVTGKASHSSRPEDGISVLPFLSELILDFKPGRIDDNTTYNLGIVTAGDATNTIPAELKLEGDIRSTVHETAEEFMTELKAYLQRLAKTHEVQLKAVWSEYCRAYSVDASSEFFAAVAASYSEAGITLKPINTTSASDAAHLRAHGIEALCLGDGVKQPHEVGEHIELDTLHQLVGSMAGLLELV